jgi:hypothetical protein
VTILGTGTHPVIHIGGTADSEVSEAGYEYAEGVRIKNILIRPNAGTERGVLIDGSTTVRATRGVARDIEFENVHITGFTDHNLELMGNVFDFRWYRGSSRSCGEDGVITTTAASYGTTHPGQIHLYDVYTYGNPTGPKWAVNGQIRMYGGGVAYGNGFRMSNYAASYGTHFEGDETAGCIGIQIVGQYQRISVPTIGSFETAVKIGDGTSTVAQGWTIDATLANCTTGLHITDGGNRYGTCRLYYASCTTDVDDDRATTDNVYYAVRNTADSTTLPVFRATTDLTNANIKDLADTPIELVAAPGAGAIIEVIDAVLALDYGSNALTEPSAPDDLAIEYDNGSGAQIATWDSTALITATADTIEVVSGGSVAAFGAAANVNKNVALLNLSDDYTGNAGNDTAMRVIVYYRLVSALGL